MTHEKMVNCWKIYLFAFVSMRMEIAIEGDTNKTPPEEVAAVALGVQHGCHHPDTKGPLNFPDFAAFFPLMIQGIDIGTVG